MAQNARFDRPDKQSTTDYGFFAGSVPAAPTNSGPFGAGPSAPPVGSSAVAGARLGRGWKVGIAAAVTVVVVGLSLVGRFGWQQFLADPVLPDTLAGTPRITNSLVEAQLESAAGAMSDELTAGSTAKVALYSDGQGTGYLLFALRGGSRPGSGDDDPTAGWTKTEQAGATCWTSPAANAGFNASMCMRGFWRRAVMVMGISATAVPMDTAAVAQATNEAWKAQ